MMQGGTVARAQPAGEGIRLRRGTIHRTAVLVGFRAGSYAPDMSYPQFERDRIRTHPLAVRKNRVHIETDHVPPNAPLPPLTDGTTAALHELVARIRTARDRDRPVICAFGAHTIKNGLAPVLIRLIETGWLTHLATNGAGVIHDWEFAHLGASSEHVAANVADGRFGMWEETGHWINLALLVGAYEGRGYGESVGALIENESVHVPTPATLERIVRTHTTDTVTRAAAAADLLDAMQRHGLAGGPHALAHPWRRFSIQAAAFRMGVPFTSHPMFGHDIIYTHPMSHGAAVGRTAERDFLAFAQAVSGIGDGGVYLSIGSAVMSPMVFEKSFAMAQNLAQQTGPPIRDHVLFVADLAPSAWDWRNGEPPEEDPAYYLRFNKTFSRMGGTMRYVQIDNRDLLLHVCAALCDTGAA